MMKVGFRFNQTALKTLGVVQNNIIGKPIRFRPLTFESNFTHGHMQHIVSWDDKVINNIDTIIQGRQLFLMAFHQSHTSFSVANAPDDILNNWWRVPCYQAIK
ncbi:hypothetical protein ACLB1T_05570 [Escherichia coli]